MWSTVEHADSETVLHAVLVKTVELRVRETAMTVSDRDGSLVFKCAA